MGKTFSLLGSQEEENKLIPPHHPAIGSKAASYSSTGSRKSFCSGVPCEGAAGASFVTCPTCRGSGEIPRGEWPKPPEIDWNPGKDVSRQSAQGQTPLSLFEWGLVSQLLVPQFQAGQGGTDALGSLQRPPSALGGFQPLCFLSNTVP